MLKANPDRKVRETTTASPPLSNILNIYGRRKNVKKWRKMAGCKK